MSFLSGRVWRVRPLATLLHLGQQGPDADRLQLDIGVVQQAIEFVDLASVVGLRHGAGLRKVRRFQRRYVTPGSWQIDDRITPSG